MNEVTKLLKNHRSIRSYTDEPVSDEQINEIITAAQAAPSSIHGQQITIIGVKDKEKKAKLAEYAGNQPYIDQAPIFFVFCMDYNRAKIAAELNGVELVITEGVESVIVGSTDAGLAMGNAIAAAQSMGLGIVPIGGVRKDPQAVIDLLELPENVFPVCGLVVGHPAGESAKKPRFPKEVFYHEDAYNHNLKDSIKEYDEFMSDYMSKRTGGQESRNWSQTISGFYKQIYYPNVHPTLMKQGFKLK